MKTIWFTLFLSLLFTFKVSASEWPVTSQSEIELAKLYNSLLNRGNIKEAKKLVSADIVFSDPTWGAFNKDKEHLLQAFDPKLLEGYHNMEYRIRNLFSSKGTVVIHMLASADVQPQGSNNPADRVHTVIDLIRVIEIKNNLVVRHIDLADYDRGLPAILSKANHQ